MVTALMGFAMQTHALPINTIDGTITFAGGVTLDSPSSPPTVGDSTGVTSWVNPKVQSTSGDFSSVANGTSVTISAPWSFTSGPISGFWTVGGFTFDLSSSSVDSQSAHFVSVTGTGTISGNGFTTTPGDWLFTTQDKAANSVFSFSASSSAPDGGATAMLLGIGFLGLAGLRRKLA